MMISKAVDHHRRREGAGGMERLKKYGHWPALVLILLMSGFLAFYQIGNEGFSNTYYSAAVRSMMTSWHNFFFASFDPGGFVSVDKPALGLWLQVLSAKIFGFYGWSLILPEALSAAISTGIVYHLAKRSFGKAAGLLSALIFSITPILVAVSRTNNLDSSLLMTLLFAVWALIVASEKSSLKHLILAMVLVGIGFNIKMLEAFMVLPAFYLVYFLLSGLKTGKKIGHLAIASIVLITISLSWAVAVDLTPSDQRPYVGSSGDNSELGLALGYNGIERITGINYGNPAGSDNGTGGFSVNDGINGQMPDGRMPGDDGSMPRDGRSSLQPPSNGSGDGGLPNSDANGSVPGSGDNRFLGGRGGDDGRQSGMAGGFNAMGGGPGGESENGQKGILRIFNQQLAGQIGWFIPLALFGAVVLFLRMRDRHNPQRTAAKLHFWLWPAWLLPMLIYFSFAGFFHRYYLSMMAPGIALLAGIGLVEMWKTYRERDWKWVLLPVSILGAISLQSVILSRYSGWGDVLAPVIIGIGLFSSVSLIVIRLMNRDNLIKTMIVALGTGVLSLLIAPAAWSVTPILYGTQATLPYAGPELNQGGIGGRVNEFMSGVFNNSVDNFGLSIDNITSGDLISFLTGQKKDEKYLVGVSSANEAAPIIIATGQPVMAIGGFSGSDRILTVDSLENLVSTGEIRYFLIQGRGGMGLQNELINWIMQNGTLVSGFSTLYDLSIVKDSGGGDALAPESSDSPPLNNGS